MKPIEPIKERFRQVFGGDPAVISAAPGRVEFIGNHTDYNLGPVIGRRSIDESTSRFDELKSVFSDSLRGLILILFP